MKKSTVKTPTPPSPETKVRRSAALKSGLRTFRFMLIFFFMSVMMFSGALTCTIFLLFYVVRGGPRGERERIGERERREGKKD